MNKENKQLNNTELEKVTGGYTIKPEENTFWQSYNPSFTYNWGDNWGDEGYFRSNR